MNPAFTDAELEYIRHFSKSAAFEKLLEACKTKFTLDFRSANDMEGRIEAAGRLDALDQLERQISAVLDDIEFENAGNG